MKEALNHDFVVGEMYYGEKNTEDPEPWINQFKEKGYKILSVILLVNLDTCIERALCRQNDRRAPTNTINMFYHFYLKYQDNFASKANVPSRRL